MKNQRFGSYSSPLKQSFLAILTPVIIIGGIWLGYVTPTEAAFVTIVYALIVTVVFYKEQKLSKIPELMLETIKMVAPAILIVAAANVFGWIMNYEKVDIFLMNLLLDITDNKYLILLIINLVLLVLGMFLEVISAIMLVLPIMGTNHHALRDRSSSFWRDHGLESDDWLINPASRIYPVHPLINNRG